MTTELTGQVVADDVAALQHGDPAALRASFGPKATWTIRGDLPVAGAWTGAAEILDGFLAQVVATLDPEAPASQTVHRIIANGDFAVAEETSTARARSGTPYVNDYAVVFDVVDGLIDSVTECCDTSYTKRVLFEQ
jgi:ketosteroid isomerase-like protein